MKTTYFEYKCRRCEVFIHKPYDKPANEIDMLPEVLLKWAGQGVNHNILPPATIVHTCRPNAWGVADLVGCSQGPID